MKTKGRRGSKNVQRRREVDIGGVDQRVDMMVNMLGKRSFTKTDRYKKVGLSSPMDMYQMKIKHPPR